MERLCVCIPKEKFAKLNVVVKGRLPELIDKECIPICNAMNEFPGISTYCSCFGHGRKNMYVRFYAKADKRFRMIISRFPNWEILEPDCSHCAPKKRDGNSYLLKYKTMDSEEAYRESVRIARCLRVLSKNRRTE
jgi:hypothetical protein